MIRHDDAHRRSRPSIPTPPAPRSPTVDRFGAGLAGETALRLAGSTQSVPEARRWLAGQIPAWWDRDSTAVAILCVSELAANAVEHTDGTFEVAMALSPRSMRVWVRDTAPGPIEARMATPPADAGRGLAIVDALAAAWGVDDQRAGKAVWFDVRPARQVRPPVQLAIEPGL